MSISMKECAAACLALLLITSCNSGEFSGSSKKQEAAAKPKADKPAKPAGKPAKPEQTVPDDKDKGGDDDGRTDIGDLVDPGATVQPPNNTQPLTDLLTNLLKPNSDVSIVQPNDNLIVFGGDKVFHIGNNEMQNSTCIDQITPYGVAGKQYYFEFEVKKDATNVTINIDRVCGVDYNTSNLISIVNGATAVASRPIGAGASVIEISAMGLPRGHYAAVIESRMAGPENNPGAPDDFDDYIIGKVRINASQPIKPGRVGAN